MLEFELAIEPNMERPGRVALIGDEDVDTDRGTVIVGVGAGELGKRRSTTEWKQQRRWMNHEWM